jgi:hypothetical protein
MALNLVEKTTVRSPATAIERRLKPLDLMSELIPEPD